MGKEIVYCSACGTLLREREFARGLAHTRDHRPFCARCLPLHAPAPTPTLPVSPSDGPQVLRRWKQPRPTGV